MTAVGQIAKDVSADDKTVNQAVGRQSLGFEICRLVLVVESQFVPSPLDEGHSAIPYSTPEFPPLVPCPVTGLLGLVPGLELGETHWPCIFDLPGGEKIALLRYYITHRRKFLWPTAAESCGGPLSILGNEPGEVQVGMTCRGSQERRAS